MNGATLASKRGHTVTLNRELRFAEQSIKRLENLLEHGDPAHRGMWAAKLERVKAHRDRLTVRVNGANGAE